MMSMRQCNAMCESAVPNTPYAGMTAVLYARVSTDDKGQTTETQVREMKNWCESNDVIILGVYEEEKSAKDMDRKGLDSAIGRIVRGGVNILLAWSESRLSRDTGDMAMINKIVQSSGAIIRYVSSDSSRPEESCGKLINFINTWQAEEERAKLRLNTKKGMETAKINGIHCGRPLSFCFVHRVKENEKRIQREGDHKTVILSIDTLMEYADQGLSISKTAQFIGVSHETLRKELKKEGLFDKFKDRSDSAKRGVEQ